MWISNRGIYAPILCVVSVFLLFGAPCDCGALAIDFTGEATSAAEQWPWQIGVSALLVCVLLLFVIFQRKRLARSELADLVQKRTAALDQQLALTRVVNHAAVLLLEADVENYLDALSRSMEMICRFVEVDRVYLWKNSRKDDGKLYCRQLCKWTDADVKIDDALLELSYEDMLPDWETFLSRGEVLNGPVDSLPGVDSALFSAHLIQSLLVVPLFLRGEFWGFVSCDDCRTRRTFPAALKQTLESWGLLAVGAIQRGEIAQHTRHTLTKLEAIISNYKGVIWSVDASGTITTFNGQYLKKIGLTHSFLEGKKLETARLKNRHLDVIDHVEKTFREGAQDWIGEIDGGVFHSSTMPMRDGKGNIIGVVGSTDDMTHMIKLQRDLEAALKASQSASQAKSAFLANMSHEIRTPMNAIVGMTNIGKSAADMERMQYCFTRIEDASNHLLGVINDILDMSKIEANKFELSPSEFHFERMLQRVVNVVTFRVNEKRQKFTVDLDRTIPEHLIGDEQRLAQVITNLTGNAVKFTPDGGEIRIAATLLGEKDGVCTIKISVTDTGIGISSEQQARLFQSFQQAESSTTRKFGGTGLGLTISKNIVEMMGGKIWIESELGQGAIFVFTIQVQRGKEQERRLAPHGVHWGNLRILVVDDDQDTRARIANIVQEFGVSCDTAASGEDALALVERLGSYDIYFVDWKLSGIDGIGLTRVLKKKKPDPGNVFVIMVSAAPWRAVEDEAKKAGVDRFLSKPLFPSAILDSINDCLGIAHAQKEDAPPGLAPLFPGRRILLVEDVDINREIVLAMLEPTLLEIDCAENGADAVRMFRETPEKYDIIFMDVQMPEMDGYEATQSIRALDMPKAKTIPIIAMTANVFRDDVEKCLATGMNGHLGKPLNFDDVFEQLRSYLSQSATNEQP
ncbi:MAG: response regulator [Deltaproteobacteria bacterium]|jgi:PAS domain S-box-containing protein|nr:response regulator [Deltaproteobacteria bacterium]